MHQQQLLLQVNGCRHGVTVLCVVLVLAPSTADPGTRPRCSVVSTKFGNVNTDHILFICSGAFHAVKPSDMLAELQGRLPIRVELQGLTYASDA